MSQPELRMVWPGEGAAIGEAEHPLLPSALDLDPSRKAARRGWRRARALSVQVEPKVLSLFV